MTFSLLDPHTNQEILTWYDTIKKQNYFTNINDIIIQNDGISMLLYLLAICQKTSYNK